MKYKKVCYKYTLAENYQTKTAIRGYSYDSKFISIKPDGTITAYEGYGWDGCSGPTKDDKTNMVPGLDHDIKYQLMRLGVIPQECRKIADVEFKQGLKDRGMNRFRVWYYYEGVDHFAAYAAKYGTEPEVIEVA